MSASSDLHRAELLPWLRPAVGPLLAFTDDQPDPDVLRADPALVVHLIRYSRPTPTAESFAFSEGTLLQPGPCETAAELLERFPTLPELNPTSAFVEAGRALALTAAEIARRTTLCSPDAAWAAGLLSYLGQYALEQIPDPESRFTPEQMTRRLASRWRLPTWLSVAIGFPGLNPNQAVKIGGHAGLVTVLHEARRQQLPQLEVESSTVSTVESPGILPRLLRKTATARRRSAESLIVELEKRIDGLVSALSDADLHFDATLQAAKLEALAEFAAGASHEINNPLAVISGNVQRVLAHESDPENRAALLTTIKQTKRIQELLQGTRQFARPPQAYREGISLPAVVAEAVRELASETELRKVSVAADPTGPLAFADPKHVRAVIVQLVRNGIDAAGEGGWVQIGFASTGDLVEVLVDDSGTGPTEESIPHLFDPFFSGHAAGRGRGLGLSIAWRLAKQNGGTVRYSPRPGLPTRFVLTLPSAGELRLFQSA